MRIFVVDVTALALTLEATWRVHASAMGAHGRHQGAFVDLLGMIRDRVHDFTRHESAQNLVFTCEGIVQLIIISRYGNRSNIYYLRVLSPGHFSQRLPHAAPMEQQHNIFVCGCTMGLRQCPAS